MLITKKMLLVLTLVGALVGAGIGALITRTGSGSTSASTTPSTTYDANKYSANPTDPNYRTPEQLAADKFKTTEEQTAFREGFSDGYTSNDAQTGLSSRNYSASSAYSTYRAPVRRYYHGRRVYYDYGNSRGRSFWQKHRDKLTLAMGTGTGALIGGLIGGKKGAGIGSLAGLGGSALYTYKLRHRRHRY